MRRKTPKFPRLSRLEMAEFLAIKAIRLSWATREKIVERDSDGLYRPEVVTAQWLAYERSPRARVRKRGSEFERARARLTLVKAQSAERRLAVLDHRLLATDDIVESVKMVCLRIKSKLQSAIPRLARSCYHAPSVTEAMFAARREFDAVIAELSALEDGGSRAELELVRDDANGEIGPATG
jgi:hypothetical protein